MVCCITLWWDGAGKGRGWKTAAIIYCWQQQHVRGRTTQLSDIASGATCVADLDSRALARTKEASGNSRVWSDFRQSELEDFSDAVHAQLYIWNSSWWQPVSDLLILVMVREGRWKKIPPPPPPPPPHSLHELKEHIFLSLLVPTTISVSIKLSIKVDSHHQTIHSNIFFKNLVGVQASAA